MTSLALYGYDLFGEPVNPEPSGIVAEKFTMPPFSLLDARSGSWQERKRAWIRMGLKGEQGRDSSLTYSMPLNAWYSEKMEEEYYGDEAQKNNTSIFDPVLTELVYKWFCPKGGLIVDPFAGGSVRGIVAGMLERHYWGCDLREEQIQANMIQGDELRPKVMPKWVCGDSMEKLTEAPEADFIFSCPPYGDLEIYSKNPADLSNMEYHTFIPAYKRIILRACKKLKENRFACFLVGDFRDKKGFYRNFVSETIKAFNESGMELYNEAILATAIGSASMRVSRSFTSGRKLAKTHQNILVFVKGDWKKATNKINENDRFASSINNQF